jgi:hypothetical protein
MKKLLFVAGALLLAAPVTAYAHDDDYYGAQFRHRVDHAEHERLHEEFNAAHEDAHDEGFMSPQEHRDWHRAYGDTHEAFHEDHPGTRHDHYDGYRNDGYRNTYRPSYYYQRSYDYSPAWGLSWTFGR